MERRIKWYKTSVEKDELRKLTQRSDVKGFIQAGSFLVIYLFTVSLSCYFFLRQQWVAMVITCYIHSMFHGFIGMGASVHELSHYTPFKTKRLNEFFYRLFSFLTWNNPIHFRESHMKHHQYTVHKGLDKEVILEPIALSWRDFVGWFTFDYKWFWKIMKPNIAHFFGNADVDFFFWDPLFPEDDPKRQKMVNWARFMVVGHLILLGIFIYFKLWVLIYTVTFGYFFATLLVHGCEIQQHLGLQDSVPDWRICAYTVKFNPLMSYLYWNMNYHIEHHMYAGVPFYNLPKFHKLLAHDLPPQFESYLSTIKHVLSIQQQQRSDRNYRFMPEFPATANPAKLTE